MAPRSSYPLPAQHPFAGLDAWWLLSVRAAASSTAPFLTWHPFDGDGRSWSYGEIERVIVPHQVTVVAALPRSTISKVNKATLRTFLNSSDPLEQAEQNWLAEAAADPSGDAL
jgi:hypothetical protein